MTDWSLMAPVLELVQKHENHLQEMGVHDNQRCLGLWLRIFPDGSGFLMQDYAVASHDESEELRLLRTVFSDDCEKVCTFESMEQLHGELVSLTMKVQGGGSNDV